MEFKNTLVTKMEFKYVLTEPNAQAPKRNNYTDSGLDLTLIGIKKHVGKVTLYKTGVKVKPQEGFYFDLVPRSSIIKTGYMLANSVGIIDADYTGEILVPLIKVDPDKPDLSLPNRIVQLIPRKWYDTVGMQVNELEETDRSDKGFGSSGNV